MKVVILAGGLGTRLSEETETKPKPMIEIGDRPILWHIMKIYAHFGFTDFYIAMGYKGEVIKRYFWDLQNLSGSLNFELSNGKVKRYGANHLNWNVHLIETGIDTQTGGRIKRMQSYLGEAPFMLTYGDGVANVDLHALWQLHRSAGRVGTVTAVRPRRVSVD
jgi:glucose-1-phosphate cytidylyltransferase